MNGVTSDTLAPLVATSAYRRMNTHPSTVSPRAIVALLVAVLLCAGAGCKPAPPVADGAHPPTTENLRTFFEAGAPSGLKVNEVKADPPVHQPDGSWLVNVKLVLTPTEDLLTLPAAGDAQSTDRLVGELNRLARWHDDYARSPYAKACGLFEVHVPAASVPQLLVVLQPKDKPLAPLYGKVAAEWQVDHWQFQPQGFTAPPSLGEPRATFQGTTMVQGSPEAEKTLREVRDDIAQARKDIELVRHRYAEQVTRGIKPDTTYTGAVNLDGSTVTCELRFLLPPAGSSGGDAPLASFQVTLTGMRPACWYVYHARVNTELPLAVPGPQPPTADDELSARLYAYGHPDQAAAPTCNVSPGLVLNSQFDVGRNALANALSSHGGSPGLLLLDGRIEGVLSNTGSNGVRLSVQQKP